MQINQVARPVSPSGAQRGAAQQGRRPMDNALSQAATAQPGMPLPGAPGSQMGTPVPTMGSNALMSAMPAAAQLQPAPSSMGAPMPPSGAMMQQSAAAPSAQPSPTPASPNPVLDQIGAGINARNLPPSQAAAAAAQANYFVHAFGPLVRQKTPITTGQLIQVGKQAIEDGQATRAQVGALLGSLPNDPAQIKQAVDAHFTAALLASIHAAGATPGNPQTPPAPDGA